MLLKREEGRKVGTEGIRQSVSGRRAKDTRRVIKHANFLLRHDESNEITVERAQ